MQTATIFRGIPAVNRCCFLFFSRENNYLKCSVTRRKTETVEPTRTRKQQNKQQLNFILQLHCIAYRQDALALGRAARYAFLSSSFFFMEAAMNDPSDDDDDGSGNLTNEVRDAAVTTHNCFRCYPIGHCYDANSSSGKCIASRRKNDRAIHGGKPLV